MFSLRSMIKSGLLSTPSLSARPANARNKRPRARDGRRSFCSASDPGSRQDPGPLSLAAEAIDGVSGGGARQPSGFNNSVRGLLWLALLCGLGGGNFASSMANISFFFPKAEGSAQRHRPTRTRTALAHVRRALACILDDRLPGGDRRAQRTRLAPQFEQP